MEPSQSFQPANPIQDEDPALPPFDASLENNTTTPHLVFPQTQRSTGSTPSHPPMNLFPQSHKSFFLKERPYTLTEVPNTHNCYSIFFTSSTSTTQPTPITLCSHQPLFLTPTSLDATRTPQSILTPPLTSNFACINSTASSSFVRSIGNPPTPSNLSISSLNTFFQYSIPAC